MAVAQYDHLLPKAARRLRPGEFVPWVEALLGQGHSVHVVYEACGFGFSLYRQLIAAGAHCYVIAPCKLDEECRRVKTDPRDATTLCQRLSRYLEGNTRELAVIRVPSQEQEQARHVSRQRTQLVCHRQKLEAQGRSLLISHALPAPAHWWKEQTWTRLGQHLPAWITTRLQMARPALLSLQEQINALTNELEGSAPSTLPRGVGKLTSVMLTREICDWHRFNNRRAISSYTGLCPGERSSGSKHVPGAGPSAVMPGSARRWWSVPGAWCASSRSIHQCKSAWASWQKAPRALGAVRKKAIVAVARRLAVDLWRLHTGRCTAEQLGLKL